MKGEAADGAAAAHSSEGLQELGPCKAARFSCSFPRHPLNQKHPTTPLARAVPLLLLLPLLQEVIKKLPSDLKVVDLSADFRLKNPATYAEW